jgi:hypothetical protein
MGERSPPKGQKSASQQSVGLDYPAGISAIAREVPN